MNRRTNDFNSRTSCEVRRDWLVFFGLSKISTHAPLTRCDEIYLCSGRPLHISTHAPLTRCDACKNPAAGNAGHFNSRTSCEVRHLRDITGDWPAQISTHAPLARCDATHVRVKLEDGISTHAPLARCDDILLQIGYAFAEISTHAPLTRCDKNCYFLQVNLPRFFNRTGFALCSHYDKFNSFRDVLIDRNVIIAEGARNFDTFFFRNVDLIEKLM